MRCAALTKDGQHCRNNAIPGSKSCYLSTHGGIEASVSALITNFLQNHWVILLSVAGSVSAILAIISFFTPDLSVTPRNNPVDLLQADFVFNNNGNVTLRDVRPVVEGWLEVPSRGSWSGPTPKKPLRIGDIPPGQSRTYRPIFPIPFKKAQWKSIFVCIGVSVRTFPFPFVKIQLPSYCFSLQNEDGLDHWVERPPEKAPTSSSFTRIYFFVDDQGFKLQPSFLK